MSAKIFVQATNKLAQSQVNPAGKSILFYGLSRPDTWALYKDQCAKQLGIPERKVNAGVRALEKEGLGAYIKVRNKCGRYIGTRIIVSQTPMNLGPSPSAFLGEDNRLYADQDCTQDYYAAIGRTRHVKRGFTKVCTGIARSKLNPDAKAMLAYGLSRPERWQFSIATLHKHLGISHKRASAAFKSLYNEGRAVKLIVLNPKDRSIHHNNILFTDKRLCMKEHLKCYLGEDGEYYANVSCTVLLEEKLNFVSTATKADAHKPENKTQSASPETTFTRTPKSTTLYIEEERDTTSSILDTEVTEHTLSQQRIVETAMPEKELSSVTFDFGGLFDSAYDPLIDTSLTLLHPTSEYFFMAEKEIPAEKPQDAQGSPKRCDVKATPKKKKKPSETKHTEFERKYADLFSALFTKWNREDGRRKPECVVRPDVIRRLLNKRKDIQLAEEDVVEIYEYLANRGVMRNGDGQYRVEIRGGTSLAKTDKLLKLVSEIDKWKRQGNSLGLAAQTSGGSRNTPAEPVAAPVKVETEKWANYIPPMEGFLHTGKYDPDRYANQIEPNTWRMNEMMPNERLNWFRQVFWPMLRVHVSEADLSNYAIRNAYAMQIAFAVTNKREPKAREFVKLADFPEMLQSEVRAIIDRNNLA